MSRKYFDEFSKQEIKRIFMAISVSEAEKVEKLLTENNIDYAVNMEPYYRISPFQTEHLGAAFYVVSGQAGFCRQMLKKRGLDTGIVEI